ncbi:MAG: electron transport complex subunit RsxB [Magnetococcales bacterium]|nr:electron transport complex subunit RsxB [Magnetococcales bacterium]
MINAILSMGGLALVAGLGLGFAAKKFHVEGDPTVDKLEEVMPATNCGNCGYPGCRPYAEAVANEDEAINLCPPGGTATMEAIAAIMGVDPAPMEERAPSVAYIDEEKCIGCTACIKACPVDAIIGANKQSHTVIIDECTDCDKCIEPCPTDCITMVPKEVTLYTWSMEKPDGPHALH